ncbi:MAG: VanZ family protein, partial [Bdellovibrionales bacterium]|nr:VanZ family protein [Bdellovibrionales bacterium]
MRRQTVQIILILFVANVALSLSSCHSLRSSLPWIKNIRQSSEIKVRHFVQFSPQTYIVARTLLPVTSLGPLSITTISFGSVSLFGVLSEFLQSFSPSRIASKMDVFWDLLASLFGLIVFWGFHLPRISSSRATRRILRYFILATVVTSSLLLLYQELINAVPFNDSFRVVQAGNSPHFNEPSYWSYILTHLNNEGRQYRPLSHFVFYGLLSQIFPKLESPTIFWLGISLVVTFVLLLYELLNRLVKSSNLSLFVCYLTPLHPVFIRNINNAHHLAKYLPPLLMLTSFLLWVEHKKSTTIMSGVLGAGWLALCMGFHEGSFVFSFLILGWMIYRKIELNWPFILSLLFPSLFYGYMRLFKWGIPESGFMAVDVSQIPLGMSYYISVFFLKNSDWWVNRGDALFGTLATILFLLISYLLLKSSSKNRYWILPCLLFLAILPFAGLKNHFDWNRGI